MVQDEFDLKQTEKNLLQSLSLLQATLDSTADGILVVDRSGRRTNYNKQYKVIFNISEEILKSGDDAAAVEFVKNQLIEPDQFVAKIKYLYNHPELESCDTLELKDGRIIERFSRPQFLDGNQIGRVWSFRDVTDRKKAEQQLYLMAQTLKSINECISLTDINDRILFINEAYLRTYGYTEQELIGQNISIVRSPHNNQEVVNKIMDITTDSGWKGEILNRRKEIYFL